MRLNVGSSALALGIFVAFIHIVWSLAVFLGIAEPWLNFVLGLHFLSNPYVVGSFDFGKALLLIGVTFLVGYAMGWVFATIWNKVHKGK